MPCQGRSLAHGRELSSPSSPTIPSSPLSSHPSPPAWADPLAVRRVYDSTKDEELANKVLKDYARLTLSGAKIQTSRPPLAPGETLNAAHNLNAASKLSEALPRSVGPCLPREFFLLFMFFQASRIRAKPDRVPFLAYFIAGFRDPPLSRPLSDTRQLRRLEQELPPRGEWGEGQV